MTIRKKFLVSGTVQGIGYRWFVQEKAEKYSLTGLVCNLYDGSVNIEA
ncbi:MAG: acylphosphatase, partial [bacterium]